MAEEHRLNNVLFSLVNCMLRTLCKRLFKSSSTKQYLYLFPKNTQYVRSFDKVNKTYVDIDISKIEFNEDSNNVYDAITKEIPYHEFVRFAKTYRIDKDIHDYPVDDKYAQKSHYNVLVDTLVDDKCGFEKKLFRVMTSLYKKSNLLFLDDGKKHDYEKLFY